MRELGCGKPWPSSLMGRLLCFGLLPAILFSFLQLRPFSENANSELKNKTLPLASVRQKHAGQSQIQEVSVTWSNRYPNEYSTVQKYFQNLDSKEAAGGSTTEHGGLVENGTKTSLLSFGSSTGAEAITLATMYFNDTKFKIFGVDLNQDSIEKAKAAVAAQDPKLEDGKVTFFNGNNTEIGVYGPYDAIFANSVLCFTQGGVTPKSIIEKFPFEQFKDILGYLDASLKVGGVLAIVNTNYHFSHVEDLYKKYRPISQCLNPQVRKVDVKNVTFEKYDRNELLDCVWVKESA